MELELEPRSQALVRYSIRVPAGASDRSYHCALGFRTLPTPLETTGAAMHTAVRMITVFYLTTGNPAISGVIKELKLEQIPNASGPLWRTVVIMENFDPERYLQLVQQWGITHTQLVPTMFSRMLKLPEAARSRYDLSSLKVVIHAAAPCPVQVKEQMIAWWGPIIHEYYGATEGLGFAACDSEQWLAHRGTVGKVLLGELHVLAENMQPCPKETPGTLWFKTATPFEYFNDPAKTKEARSQDGSMSTVGDVGYVDDDGFLYLTDRATFMIVSGGVNIYPQECENLLITHPKVADAAVFGVPNEDLGEEVKAVVQVLPGIKANSDLVNELMNFCRAHLSHQKCPRSIDFEAELPRPPTGKLYKRVLRDRYWGDRKTRII